MFILFSIVSFKSLPQGTSCDSAIELKDSITFIPPAFSKEVWFKFIPTQKDFVLKVASNRTNPSDYFLYEGNDTNFCGSLREKEIIPFRARTCSTDSADEKIILSREELEGVCSCHICDAEDHPLHLTSGATYYLRVLNFKDTLVIDMDFDWLEELEEKERIRKKKADLFDGEIKEGQTIQLNQILFQPQSPVMLPESKKELKKLLNFMKDNPTVKIEIQGHVNAPGIKNNPQDQKLSELRAKAVYDYLIRNKVQQHRLKYAGYGNTRPVFAAPRNEQEQKKNRRVEILITGK